MGKREPMPGFLYPEVICAVAHKNRPVKADRSAWMRKAWAMWMLEAWATTGVAFVVFEAMLIIMGQARSL